MAMNDQNKAVENSLLIISTIVNDRTRGYLQAMGLTRGFDEDQDLAAVAFTSTDTMDRFSQQTVADIFLLYDGPITSRAMQWLQRLTNERPVQVILHRGTDSEEDRLRVENQRKKLSALPGLQQPILLEHASCGWTYDALMELAACLQRKDQQGYRTVLQNLRLHFNSDSLLDQRLRLLHRCLTAKGAALALAEMTLFESLMINLEDGHFIHTLVKELAATEDDGSTVYQNQLTALREILLKE
ncbi:hypothetical protein GX408_01305 [bacterium]|nr:hypothetical protein [bacterium]